jgi:hypothetical protein
MMVEWRRQMWQHRFLVAAVVLLLFLMILWREAS